MSFDRMEGGHLANQLGGSGITKELQRGFSREVTMERIDKKLLLRKLIERKWLRMEVWKSSVDSSPHGESAQKVISKV